VLTPSPAELLAGVADALATTVLPELPPGPARRQLQAAIGITSRVARALPQLGPQLEADVADVAVTLERLAASVPMLADRPDLVDTAAVAKIQARADEPARSLLDLGAFDRLLQELLAEVADSVARGAGSSDADAQVRALLGRMVAREAELGLSPWEA
jgi:hypothetical protein